MNKKFCIFILALFALVSKTYGDNAKRTISQETEAKIDQMISLMEVKARFSTSTSDFDAETQKSLDAFQENPRQALLAIAMEYQGAEKIDLLESVCLQESDAEVLKKLEVLVPADSLVLLNPMLNQRETIGLNSGIEKDAIKGRTRLGYDKKLHFMAGVSACMASAAMVYAFSKWFSFKLKAASIVAVGLSAAVLFGMAKEVYDQFDYGGADFNDFLATLFGGVGGASMSWGIFTTLKSSPAAAGVLTGVLALTFGMKPGKALLKLLREKSAK